MGTIASLTPGEHTYDLVKHCQPSRLLFLISTILIEMCILKLIVVVYYLMFCCTVEESTSDTIMEMEHSPSPMSSGTGDGDVPGMHILLSVMALHP